ncbi:hypothetical protein A5670_02990 [Mycolicibacterium fortuitum]|nr:hypothetical protein A5670_02990 [Mycolicibacterium fortuitum]
MTPLPAGYAVEIKSVDGDTFTWPAPVMVHQTTDDHAGCGPSERIALGMLNPFRGEIEMVEVDEDNQALGDLVRIFYPVNGPQAEPPRPKRMGGFA